MQRERRVEVGDGNADMVDPPEHAPATLASRRVRIALIANLASGRASTSRRSVGL